ncbi:hypothetical protein DFJ74DRAFT_708986 [Hyaloraphidium curvatum]|nr:hypothetical protein DFJ74DRAFT_708986 [Hyaloraphidium curvatum]
MEIAWEAATASDASCLARTPIPRPRSPRPNPKCGSHSLAECSLTISTATLVDLSTPFPLLDLPSELAIRILCFLPLSELHSSVRPASKSLSLLAREAMESDLRALLRRSPTAAADALSDLASSGPPSGPWWRLLHGPPLTYRTGSPDPRTVNPLRSLAALVSRLNLARGGSVPSPASLAVFLDRLAQCVMFPPTRPDWASRALAALDLPHAVVPVLLSHAPGLWMWPRTCRTGEGRWDAANLGIWCGRYLAYGGRRGEVRALVEALRRCRGYWGKWDETEWGLVEIYACGDW